MSASRAPECLRRRILPIAWSLLVWTIATVGGAAAQTFDQWFNTRIDAVLAARLGQNSGARETEAPAIARGSTAIVNETGFSDLIGIALGGGALTHGGDGGAEGASTALTVTPFAVLAGILGIDPNDPFMYEARSAWRAVSFTLGTETTEADDGSESRATLIGFKLKLWSRRTPSAETVERLRTTLNLAAAVAGPLHGTLTDSLQLWAGDLVGFPVSNDEEINDENRVAFSRLLADPARFPGILNAIGAERVMTLESLIEAAIDPFLENRRAANDVLAELKSEPQLALDVQGRVQEAGGDELRLGLGLDIGLAGRVQFTANGSALFIDGVAGAADARGGTIAAGLAFALGPERLGAADPLTLDIALEGEFLDELRPRWNAQGKLQLPVLDGLILPLSLTWSNRMDASDESGLLGRIGFAVDTARLLRAMGNE
jgi:hypothetical protein